MSQNPDFEETSLFDFFPAEEKNADKKEQKNKKTEDAVLKSGKIKEAAITAVKAIEPEAAPEKKEILIPQPQDRPVSATPAWTEKFWEYDITKPSQWIRDDMKEHMVAEGFTKREANHIFKGLVFKEKIFNTKNQALAYLKTVPTTYAVKYKIGIEPSPRMVSLKKRLNDKKARLEEYKNDQAMRKFRTEFVSCPVCRSKINSKYLTPPACPVCRSDMRAESVIHTLESLEKAVADLNKKYEYAAEKHNSRFTGGEKWIIRTVNTPSQDEKE
ncbi:hypothetical protein [Dialister sp.]|uniref:hypothetical protein n=1 Tax=Dialister sp. TaxID=1955814 RepID=UPI00257F87A8|nr:hypothetical protein [Dialister sp.]